MANPDMFMSTSNIWRAVRLFYPDRVPTDSGTWVADEDTGELLSLRVSTTSEPVELDLYQLAQAWREWVSRYEPHQFERIVSADGSLVRNRVTNQVYQTSRHNCSCESFRSQRQHFELLSQYLPDFTPVCKHVRFIRELEAYERVTVLYLVEGDRLTTWVAPVTDSITSYETGKEIRPGQVGLYYIGKPSQLPTIQSRCLTRGWQLEEWHPYGAPVLR